MSGVPLTDADIDENRAVGSFIRLLREGTMHLVIDGADPLTPKDEADVRAHHKDGTYIRLFVRRKRKERAKREYTEREAADRERERVAREAKDRADRERERKEREAREAAERVRIAIYHRVSTLEQAREGQSLQTQEERERAYVKSRNWTVVGAYSDESSGLDANRAGYRQMMADRRKWDTMLVVKIDRVHLNMKNFGLMIEQLDQWGKNFASIDESFDTSTPTGRFAMDIVIRLAQMESEQISARVLPNMETAASNHIHLGKPPAGTAWDREQRRLVPSELGAKVVRDYEALRAERNATTTAEIDGAMIEAGRMNVYPEESKFAGHTISMTTVRRIVSHLEIDGSGNVVVRPTVVPNAVRTSKGMWSRLQDLKDRELLAVFEAMTPAQWTAYCVERRRKKMPAPGFKCPILTADGKPCSFQAGGMRKHNPRPPITVPLTFPSVKMRDRHLRLTHPEARTDG